MRNRIVYSIRPTAAVRRTAAAARATPTKTAIPQLSDVLHQLWCLSLTLDRDGTYRMRLAMFP
jgi:hypothetical protein